MYTEETVTATKPAIEKITVTGLIHQHELNKKPDVVMGVGNCTHAGCNCPAYEGGGDLCGNCGHNYSYHN